MTGRPPKEPVTYTLDADVRERVAARATALRQSASALANYILAQAMGLVPDDLPAPRKDARDED